jgi:hypothetical protein
MAVEVKVALTLTCIKRYKQACKHGDYQSVTSLFSIKNP